jgi:FkbM family methyltransferase
MRNPLTSLTKRLARFRAFPQISRRDGRVLILDPKNWIDTRLLAGAPYEVDQLNYVRNRMAALSIREVVDIGANIGLYSVALGLLPQVRKVHAFEPVRRNFNQLCGNVFANRLDDKVETHALALGAADGEAIIHVDPTSTGVSRLDKTTALRSAEVFQEQETIRIARGDAALPQRGLHAFIKIDVEGHTLGVLAGLGQFLAATTGLIQVEEEGNSDAIREKLTALGWRFDCQIDSDLYFEKARDQAPGCVALAKKS